VIFNKKPIIPYKEGEIMPDIQSSVDTLTVEILILKQQTAQNIIEIGKRLNQVKEQLPHGEWLPWLEQKVEFSERTARRLMQVAKESSNWPALTDLPPSKVFALLDLPADQRESFVQNNPVDEMTTRQLQAAIKAQKEAERRAEEAESKIRMLSEENKAVAQKESQLVRENNQLLQSKQLLENKLKSADDPIIVEQPVQVFPPDYERIKRENAEFKARQQNMSLHQLAQADENFQQYRKSEEDEERSAKIVNKILSVLLDLPADQEIEEMARCYLKFSPAAKMDEITVTCGEIETGINRLQKLSNALKNATKLRAVK
jgi:DNA repair exonuclease SbcCD ATPase subunit